MDIEPDWVHLDTDENGIRMNSYFVRHPEMVLGEMVMESTQYGMDSVCRPREGDDLAALLDKAVSGLHARIPAYEQDGPEEEDLSIPADPDVRNYSFTSVDGKLYYFDADGVMQKNVNFGIDVSKYQSNIDWNKVKKAGVNFVIIRIGYRGYGASGTLVQDPMFEEHFTNARNAGLKVGVYFFTQAVTEDEAREEAQGCNWVLNGRKLDYPIYYDTEASTSPNGTGRADGLGKEDRTKCAIAFCEEVKSLGYKPGVYASTTWFRKRVDLDALRKYTIWNAHYGVSSSPIDCDMWQGTEKARINGYSGELDANISYMG